VCALVVSLVVVARPAAAQENFQVLVFSKTAGFRHGSISDGIALIQALGTANDFGVDTTENASAFTVANLAQYAVVVWLSTTGDVLDASQQAAFETYIASGGAWVGVHSATDTEYGWPWYGQLIGGDAWFQSHPAIQTATLDVEDQSHLSTAHYPSSLSFVDEWYNFQNNPRPSVNVLVTIDESTYAPGGGAMGSDHPISWYHHFAGGRAWYTAMGHRTETYQDAGFQQHLLGGILWAAGATTVTTTSITPPSTTSTTLPPTPTVPPTSLSGGIFLAWLLALTLGLAVHRHRRPSR
jgi:type 1 glutamine amidotransferase